MEKILNQKIVRAIILVTTLSTLSCSNQNMESSDYLKPVIDKEGNRTTYITSKNIGVGSTVAEVVEAYPQCLFRINMDEGGISMGGDTIPPSGKISIFIESLLLHFYVDPYKSFKDEDMLSNYSSKFNSGKHYPINLSNLKKASIIEGMETFKGPVSKKQFIGFLKEYYHVDKKEENCPNFYYNKNIPENCLFPIINNEEKYMYVSSNDFSLKGSLKTNVFNKQNRIDIGAGLFYKTKRY